VKGTDGVTSVAGTATSVLFGIGATASEEIAASSWRRRRRRRRNDGGRGAGGESRWTWQFGRQLWCRTRRCGANRPTRTRRVLQQLPIRPTFQTKVLIKQSSH